MGERRVMQEALFYGFSLERRVPDNHLPRRIDHRVSFVCGRPVGRKGFFFRLRQCGQALSCVRPHSAAVHTPRACMEVRGSGPNRRGALEALRMTLVSPIPSHWTVCPYLWNGLLTSPTSPTVVGASSANRVKSLVNPRLLSSAPMQSELCGSPAPPRRQGGAFSSTCARARTPRERLCAKPIERRTPRR